MAVVSPPTEAGHCLEETVDVENDNARCLDAGCFGHVREILIHGSVVRFHKRMSVQEDKSEIVVYLCREKLDAGMCKAGLGGGLLTQEKAAALPGHPIARCNELPLNTCVLEAKLTRN